MENLSPRDLAEAIGVSESSLKRWVDDGRIAALRTAGGHRRISTAEAVRFIRELGATIAKPELLGIRDLAAVPSIEGVQHGADEQLYQALEASDGARVRGIIQSLYIARWSLAAIFDGPIRTAMSRVGELWQHAEWGIAVEHRATDIIVCAINQLRLLAPTRPADAPIALGCALDDDPYVIPSLMAAAVMGELGFLDVNLGGITPPSVLLAAMAHHRPRVVWVSCSVESPTASVSALPAVAEAARAAGTRLIAGGRGFSKLASTPVRDVVYAASMAELEAAVRPLIPGDARRPSGR